MEWSLWWLSPREASHRQHWPSSPQPAGWPQTLSSRIVPLQALGVQPCGGGGGGDCPCPDWTCPRYRPPPAPPGEGSTWPRRPGGPRSSAWCWRGPGSPASGPGSPGWGWGWPWEERPPLPSVLSQGWTDRVLEPDLTGSRYWTSPPLSSSSPGSPPPLRTCRGRRRSREPRWEVSGRPWWPDCDIPPGWSAQWGDGLGSGPPPPAWGGLLYAARDLSAGKLLYRPRPRRPPEPGGFHYTDRQPAIYWPVLLWLLLLSRSQPQVPDCNHRSVVLGVLEHPENWSLDGSTTSLDGGPAGTDDPPDGLLVPGLGYVQQTSSELHLQAWSSCSSWWCSGGERHKTGFIYSLRLWCNSTTLTQYTDMNNIRNICQWNVGDTILAKQEKTLRQRMHSGLHFNPFLASVTFRGKFRMQTSSILVQFMRHSEGHFI